MEIKIKWSESAISQLNEILIIMLKKPAKKLLTKS